MEWLDYLAIVALLAFYAFWPLSLVFRIYLNIRLLLGPDATIITRLSDAFVTISTAFFLYSYICIIVDQDFNALIYGSYLNYLYVLFLADAVLSLGQLVLCFFRQATRATKLRRLLSVLLLFCVFYAAVTSAFALA